MLSREATPDFGRQKYQPFSGCRGAAAHEAARACQLILRVRWERQRECLCGLLDIRLAVYAPELAAAGVPSLRLAERHGGAAGGIV
jgi:hypothetical protein